MFLALTCKHRRQGFDASRQVIKRECHLQVKQKGLGSLGCKLALLSHQCWFGAMLWEIVKGEPHTSQNLPEVWP
jgi:hypothetical protein